MGSLVIALIGVAFAAVIMLAGVNYMAPGLSSMTSQTGEVGAETAQVMADYQNLQTDIKRSPGPADFQTVYPSRSPNSVYTYTGQGNGLTASRPSSIPGASSGWVFSQYCGATSGADCFCLTVTGQQGSSTFNSIYQSALSAAKRQVSSAGSSMLAYNATGCNLNQQSVVTNYAAWPAIQIINFYFIPIHHR